MYFFQEPPAIKKSDKIVMDEVPSAPPGVIELPATPELVKNIDNGVDDLEGDEKKLNGDIQDLLEDEERKYLKFYPYMTSQYFLPKLPKSFSNPLPRPHHPPRSRSLDDNI